LTTMDEPLLTRGGKIVRLLLIVSLVPLMFAIVSLGVILANAMEHLVAGRGGGIYWTAIALLALSFASLGFTLTRVVRSYRRSTDEASKRTHAAQTGPSNGVTVPPWALTVALLALDSVDAGIGDTVLIVQEGWGASTAATGEAGAAIDSAIVGVVDQIDLPSGGVEGEGQV